MSRGLFGPSKIETCLAQSGSFDSFRACYVGLPAKPAKPSSSMDEDIDEAATEAIEAALPGVSIDVVDEEDLFRRSRKTARKVGKRAITCSCSNSSAPAPAAAAAETPMAEPATLPPAKPYAGSSGGAAGFRPKRW